jgi:cytochrome c553
VNRGNAHGWRAFALAAVLAPLAAPAAEPPDGVAACEACHGKGGNSEIALTPSLAGQPEVFLATQLVYFREGLRNAPAMQEVAKGMKDAQITALARHFAASPARASATTAADPKAMQHGKVLASQMLCGQCHLPNYRGREQMPRLAAQREDYLVVALRGYRDNTRTGADTTMAGVMRGVSDADIAAIAHFMARQK